MFWKGFALVESFFVLLGIVAILYEMNGPLPGVRGPIDEFVERTSRGSVALVVGLAALAWIFAGFVGA